MMKSKPESGKMAKTELELWIEKITKENQELDLTEEFETCLNQMEPEFLWEKVKDNFMIIGEESFYFAKKKIHKAINSGLVNETNVRALFKIAYDSFKKHISDNKRLYLHKVTVSPIKWENIENVGDDNKGYRHLILQYLTLSDEEKNAILERSEKERVKREREEVKVEIPLA